MDALRASRSRTRRADVVADVQAHEDFARGVNDLVNLIRPLYGPTHRAVAVAGLMGHSKPELLHDGATVTQRLTGLQRPIDNVGALHLREVLQQIQERAGDGSSTGALIYQGIYAHGRRMVAAGYNPQRLRDWIQHYLPRLVDELRRQRRELVTSDDIRRLAWSVSGDDELAAEVASIVDTLGPFGTIEVRPGRRDRIGHDVLDEPYWATRPLETSHLDAHFGSRAEAFDCAVFVSDLDLELVSDATALLNAARTRGATALLVLARSCSVQCRQVLLANASPTFRVFLVATPGSTVPERWDALTDISLLTGARAYHAAAGQIVADLGPNDLGWCRRVWVTKTHVGLLGGEGGGRGLRHHVADLRHRYATSEDASAREQVRQRLSRITGRSAILWIDGSGDRELERRKALAERTCGVVQRAFTGGVLPGEGRALLACRVWLASLARSSAEPEEEIAIATLRQALRAPVEALATNAGREPSTVIAELEAGNGSTPPRTLDAFDAVEAALRLGVSGAAQALTIDTVVLKRNPAQGSRS